MTGALAESTDGTKRTAFTNHTLDKRLMTAGVYTDSVEDAGNKTEFEGVKIANFKLEKFRTI